MAIRYAINGFGRIGRNILRAATDKKINGLELVAINDLTDADSLAFLLEHDSVHGAFDGDVKAEGEVLKVNGQNIKVSAEREPSKLPWKDLKIDVVLECTGIFASRDKAAMHLEAGAKKVIVSAPCSNADVTLVYGVNEKTYDSSAHDVISNGSCTTNCLAPVAKILLDNFGIAKGLMTTIHSYTNDQKILDLPHKDRRRMRAAALSMIPTTTGAAKALSLVIPELEGKMDGMAIRVPTPNVSLVDLVCELEKDASEKDINNAFTKEAKGSLKGILDVSPEPLVSCDFNGNNHSSSIDLLSTKVIGGRMVKILSWYDNEMGFSNRMLDILKFVARR